MKEFKKYFFEYFRYESDFINLINNLTLNFQVLVFGGFVRDFIYESKLGSRDTDIVVNIENDILFDCISSFIDNDKITINQFGGYKLILNNSNVDIWSTNETWAIKNGYFTKEELLKTVYLNIDAYAYDLTNNMFLEDCNHLRISTIDIAFPINPNEELNLARSLVLSHKYGIDISNAIKSKLREILNSKIKRTKFLKSQINHYGKVKITINNLYMFLGKEGH